jgi:transcriptional antiterminator NusG
VRRVTDEPDNPIHEPANLAPNDGNAGGVGPEEAPSADPEEAAVDSAQCGDGAAVAPAERPGDDGPDSPDRCGEPVAPEAAQAPPKGTVLAAEAAPAVSEPVEPAKVEQPKSEKMDWYILKVQSNREESIREGLRRRIAIAGYEHYFGEIIIPTEKVTEVKGGRKRTYKRKLYPGYLVVQMEINEDTWFLIRETTGIGDFTGAGGHPTPMNPSEVQSILRKQEEKPDQQEKVKINFSVGDKVKIKEGTFENFEGEVSSIDETNGRVTVLINIFGRSTPVDIEYWQIEAI